MLPGTPPASCIQKWLKTLSTTTFTALIKQITGKKTNYPVKLVSSSFFTTKLLDIDIPVTRDYSNIDSFVIYICMAGHCTIKDNKGNSEFIQQGESMLIPADTESVIIIPSESSKLLETYLE